MSVPNVFQNINESLTRTSGGNTVFGEPVSSGDTKVIPVARVAYGFGGGSGTRNRATESGGQEGMGGGGGIIAIPRGVVEVTPKAHVGSRFVRTGD